MGKDGVVVVGGGRKWRGRGIDDFGKGSRGEGCWGLEDEMISIL